MKYFMIAFLFTLFLPVCVQAEPWIVVQPQTYYPYPTAPRYQPYYPYYQYPYAAPYARGYPYGYYGYSPYYHPYYHYRRW